MASDLRRDSDGRAEAVGGPRLIRHIAGIPTATEQRCIRCQEVIFRKSDTWMTVKSDLDTDGLAFPRGSEVVTDVPWWRQPKEERVFHSVFLGNAQGQSLVRLVRPDREYFADDCHEPANEIPESPNTQPEASHA